ncbi:hypothetical protein Nepgr_028907 [Nepenthes gracilis]|uniref:Uncharacterized protein n=1 Tax=Nepenthes gracilis TaxID=150966 RepID=A0AAD3TDR4_NEPGR|nr:hypothetical protein Nepgr_028907 [Nepenthes gracilis]
MLAPLNYAVQEATHESPKNLDPGVNDSIQIDIGIEQRLDPLGEMVSCSYQPDPGSALGKASVDHMTPEFLDDNADEDRSQNVDIRIDDMPLNSCQNKGICTDPVIDAVSSDLVVEYQMDVLQPDVEAIKSMVRDRNDLLWAQFMSEHQKKPTGLLVPGLDSKTMENQEMSRQHPESRATSVESSLEEAQFPSNWDSDSLVNVDKLLMDPITVKSCIGLLSTDGRDSPLEEQESLTQKVDDVLMCGCSHQENIKVERHPVSYADIMKHGINSNAADETARGKPSPGTNIGKLRRNTSEFRKQLATPGAHEMEDSYDGRDTPSNGFRQKPILKKPKKPQKNTILLLILMYRVACWFA